LGPLQSSSSFASARPVDPAGTASREVLAPADTTTSGAPLRDERPFGRPPGTRIDQILAGSALGVLAPLDGFGLPHDLRREVPDASRPCCMPLASLELAPSELSLPGEPYPLSRATCFLASSSSDQERRSACRSFTAAFASSSQPFAARIRLAADHGTHEPGRRFPAVASPVASTHPEVSRTCRPIPAETGLAVLQPARPLRSLAPPGSPFRDDPRLGQAGAIRRCSPGVLDPPELSPPWFRVRSLADSLAGGSRPRPRAPPGAQSSRLHAATWTPTPGLASPGSVDTPHL